jgi:hypothetical protein
MNLFSIAKVAAGLAVSATILAACTVVVDEGPGYRPGPSRPGPAPQAHSATPAWRAPTASSLHILANAAQPCVPVDRVATGSVPDAQATLAASGIVRVGPAVAMHSVPAVRSRLAPWTTVRSAPFAATSGGHSAMHARPMRKASV